MFERNNSLHLNLVPLFHGPVEKAGRVNHLVATPSRGEVADVQLLGSERVGGDFRITGGESGNQRRLPDIRRASDYNARFRGVDGGKFPECVASVVEPV